ncbi:MAG: guanylate kinase [Candidatus Binataceae bacterium]|nr:guanylate kinase [Candidatus Binataceae bacterium]
MLAQGPTRRGIIFIVSAPSGAGKTTISRAALKKISGLRASISLTTREPREGEVDGIDYHFVTDEEFIRRRAAGELAEWARVFDSSYGTPRTPLDEAVARGNDMLLDIDIQGASQIRQSYPADTASIFVLPPSFPELEERLRRRGTETGDAIARRLMRARQEASAFRDYDYLIINAHREESLEALKTIVEGERLKVGRLREEFAPWKS